MRGLLAIILTTAMLWSMPSFAQLSDEEAPDVGPEQEAEAEEESGVNNGAISIDAGFDYSSMYIFRGLIVEDEGVILWPWLELGFTFFENEGAFSSLSLTLGNWNSLHYNNESGSGGENPDPSAWFESDAYVGLAFGFIEALEVAVTYYSYNSPNSAFRTLKELHFNIGYDDSGVWENVGVFEGIYPWVSLAVEIAGQGDGGTGEGIYMELGVEPTLDIGSEDYSISVAIPLVVGLSLRDYFEWEEDPDSTISDSTFGYFDVALVVGLPLPFIPEAFGEWSITGNFHVTVLSEAAQYIGGDDDGDADQVQYWGGAGIGFSY